MAGKVIHVSEFVHQAAKEYCADSGVPLGIWIEQLISHAIDIKAPIDLSIVKKKKMEEFSDLKDEDIWSKQPFWSDK